MPTGKTGKPANSASRAAAYRRLSRGLPGRSWKRPTVPNLAVARYPKRAFPTQAVFGPEPDPVLRLITCGGRFDRARRSYVDNVIVTAHLAKP
jgi:hypothetical protein